MRTPVIVVNMKAYKDSFGTPGLHIGRALETVARETGAGTLVSACPFCLSMFEDGLAAGGPNAAMKALDMAEIIAARIIRE